MKPRPNDISTNRKALRDYLIVERYEAGICLRGTEVKSIRAGHMNLNDAFVKVERGNPTMYQSDIQPYDKASHTQHEARSPRRLLLNKREIEKIASWSQQKGGSVVALRAYWKGPFVKIELGLGKGKNKSDQRQDLKMKAEKREMDRAVAGFNRRRG